MTHRTEISSADAAGLYEVDNGETVNDWIRIADEDLGSDRWMQNYYLVVQHVNDADISPGTYYGIYYAHGLTEYQDHEYPWREGNSTLPLVPLYRHRIVTTAYRTKPAEDQK